MKVFQSLAVIFIALFLSGSNIARAAESSELDQEARSIRIELDDSLITLETHDAPLPNVLYEIGKLVGFETVIIATLTEFPLISVSFEKLTAREIVDRIVDNTSRIIFFVVNDDKPLQRKISQVWLLGSSGVSLNPTTDDAEQPIMSYEALLHDDGKIRSEAVLRLSQQTTEGLSQEHKKRKILEIIAGMLHRDQDPLVRTRAAIALGALKEESSVPDLESALQDKHASVRAQVINALGQIGGDRATMVLGEILISENVGSIERVLAAQALWKQDSIAARSYLRVGAEDRNTEVNMASSKKPSSRSENTRNKQYGPEVTE